jgi:hypothetical protein
MANNSHEQDVEFSANNSDGLEKAIKEHHEHETPFSPLETRKLLRKLDFAILPLVSVMYLLSFLDRSNIGNARLAGLEKDLGMTGWDYAVSQPQFISKVMKLIQSIDGRQCFLPFLHSVRGTVEPRHEKVPSLYLDSIYHACVGHRHDLNGHCS